MLFTVSAGSISLSELITASIVIMLDKTVNEITSI